MKDEKNGFNDRCQTRDAVLDAVKLFLHAVLYAPGDKNLDVERLWAEAKPIVISTVREFRARARQRFAEEAAATESLG